MQAGGFFGGNMKELTLEATPANVDIAIEEREIGGMGIFIVKKSMDAVNYEYKDGKNILTIKKNFNSE